MQPEDTGLDARLPLYAALGEHLSFYEVLARTCSIEAKSTIALPANVQFAASHGAKPILYVATSNRRSGLDGGDVHHLASVATHPVTGELRFSGDPIRLAHRPIHISTTADTYLLVAYNDPSIVEVYALDPDGCIGPRLGRRAFGSDCVYPHHVSAMPDGHAVIVAVRGLPGNGPDEPQAAPGSLRVLSFSDGGLGSASIVAPLGGHHFGPRDVAFHPTKPWVFVSLEIQNKLAVFEHRHGALSHHPLFLKDTLPPEGGRGCRQLTGAVKLHPSGRFAYCANRGSGQGLAAGGACEPFNGFTVFSIDLVTGEPKPLQHVDSGGFCPRTFSLDKSGLFLAAGNAHDHVSSDGTRTPANIALFRVAAEGTLELEAKFAPKNAHSQELFWAGFA